MSEPMNVRSLARLARLAFAPEEEERLGREMEDILAFARQLQDLDVAHVPPTQHVLELHTVLREDDVRPSLSREAILAAAPCRVDAYIAVPRTVEEGEAE